MKIKVSQAQSTAQFFEILEPISKVRTDEFAAVPILLFLWMQSLIK